MYASANVDTSLAEHLSQVSGIPMTSDMGRYSGVNFVHGRVTNTLFSNLLDCISSRLEGWKTKFLSMTSRQVLIKSVVNTILLQTNMLPMGICYKAESLLRKFL